MGCQVEMIHLRAGAQVNRMSHLRAGTQVSRRVPQWKLTGGASRPDGLFERESIHLPGTSCSSRSELQRRAKVIPHRKPVLPCGPIIRVVRPVVLGEGVSKVHESTCSLLPAWQRKEERGADFLTQQSRPPSREPSVCPCEVDTYRQQTQLSKR
jgi:hypothetical protein